MICAVTFYRNKQKKRTGSEENFAECIKISPAEGMSKMFFHDEVLTAHRSLFVITRTWNMYVPKYDSDEHTICFNL